MSEIRIQKIDWVEFVTYKDYLRLKEEKQELEYLWDINEELKEENQKLKEERDELKKEFQQYKEHYNIEKDKQQIFLMTWLRY